MRKPCCEVGYRALRGGIGKQLRGRLAGLDGGRVYDGTAHRPSTMPQEKAKAFGEKMPVGRAGQPAELAGAYVLLASGLGSYITGAVIPVTGGSIMI